MLRANRKRNGVTPTRDTQTQKQNHSLFSGNISDLAVFHSFPKECIETLDSCPRETAGVNPDSAPLRVGPERQDEPRKTPGAIRTLLSDSVEQGAFKPISTVPRAHTDLDVTQHSLYHIFIVRIYVCGQCPPTESRDQLSGVSASYRVGAGSGVCHPAQLSAPPTGNRVSALGHLSLLGPLLPICTLTSFICSGMLGGA